MRIFRDAFLFVDTYGLPLELVMEHVHKRNCVTDISAFLKDALLAGWSKKKALAKAEEGISALVRQHCLFLVGDSEGLDGA